MDRSSLLHPLLRPIVATAALMIGVASSRGAETLQEIWTRALTVDRKIEAQQWQASAAQSGYEAARAELFPSLKGSYGYVVLDNPVGLKVDTPPLGLHTALEATQQDFMVAGVAVTQPLYTFGRIRYGIDAAGSQVNAALAEGEKTELDVMLDAAEAYLNVLNAIRSVEVTQASADSLEHHLRDVKNMLEQGMVVRNDYLAVEVALADARQNRLQARNVLELTKAALNRAVQRPLDTPVELADLREPAGTYDLDIFTQQALALRPEIALLDARACGLRNQAAAVRAENKPQVLLTGRYDYLENSHLIDQTFTSVNVMAEWNFFDSGRNRNAAVQLDQNAEATLRLRADAESLIELQVRQAWLDLDTARRRVEVTRQALRSADENLTIAQNRYRQGLGTNTEVLDAEQFRTETYRNFHHSRYAAVMAMFQLQRAAGRFDLTDVLPAGPADQIPPAEQTYTLPRQAPLPGPAMSERPSTISRLPRIEWETTSR